MQIDVTKNVIIGVLEKSRALLLSKNGEEYESLYHAALCRERADWIVGINATRLFSTLYGQTLNVGRVMTPTLALAVEREAKIKGFHPENFYTLVANCEGITLSSNHIDSKEKANEIREATERSKQKIRIYSATNIGLYAESL